MKDRTKHAYPISTGWSLPVCSGACQITLEPFWNFSISSLTKLRVLAIWSVFDGLSDLQGFL